MTNGIEPEKKESMDEEVKVDPNKGLNWLNVIVTGALMLIAISAIWSGAFSKTYVIYNDCLGFVEEVVVSKPVWESYNKSNSQSAEYLRNLDPDKQLMLGKERRNMTTLYAPQRNNSGSS